MANCTVKRDVTVTLVLNENEAAIIKALLGKSSGLPPDGLQGVYNVLDAQGVPEHPEKHRLQSVVWK